MIALYTILLIFFPVDCVLMGTKSFIKIVKWDAKARETYDYDYQNVSFGKRDDWVSHAASVIAGKRYQDDSDGLAATVLDLLYKDGISQNHLYRAAIDSTGGSKADYFAGLAWDGSKWHVIGSIYSACYPYSQLTPKPLCVSLWGSNEWIDAKSLTHLPTNV